MPGLAEDPLLPALRTRLDRLLELTRAWSRGQPEGDEAEDVRRQAVHLNHARYFHLIPVYRHLAAEEGLGESADLDAIVAHTMLADEVFKSYRPEWIESRAFDRMTGWLGERFTRRLRLDAAGIGGTGDWKARLKGAGVYLSISSGTSGRLSFVPRDGMTLEALMGNGRAYYHQAWTPDASGGYGDFDCLVLGGAGAGMGLQSAGTGLARMARRAHFLIDFEVLPDFAERPAVASWDAAFEASLAFLRRSAAEGVRCLVFGAPFQVQELCDRIAAGPGSLPVAPGSLLISGGGWKAYDGRRMPRERLWERIGETLAISADRIIDTYSTAELNCVFMTCSRGHYHIPPLVEPVVLDEAYNGEPGCQGTGVLGVLDPFAFSYPGFVITEDWVDLARGECGCGLSGWHIRGEIHRAPGREQKGCGGVMAAVTG